MCLILHKLPEDEAVSRELVDSAFKKNPDGWGIIVLTPDATHKPAPNILQRNKMFVKKGVTETSDELWAIIEKAHEDGLEYICHFRHKTHGDVNEANCHPYHIVDDFYFIHNGVIRQVPDYNRAMSDTWHFVDSWMVNAIKNHSDPYNFVRSDNFRWMLEKLGGSGNRFAVVDKYGVTRFNESEWKKTTKGVCVSNHYAFSGSENPSSQTYQKSANVFTDTGYGTSSNRTSYSTGSSYNPETYKGKAHGEQDNFYTVGQLLGEGEAFEVGGRLFNNIGFNDDGTHARGQMANTFKSVVHLIQSEVTDFKQDYKDQIETFKKNKAKVLSGTVGTPKKEEEVTEDKTEVKETVVTSTNTEVTVIKSETKPRGETKPSKEKEDDYLALVAAVEEVADICDILVEYPEKFPTEVVDDLITLDAKAARGLIVNAVSEMYYEEYFDDAVPEDMEALEQDEMEAVNTEATNDVTESKSKQQA